MMTRTLILALSLTIAATPAVAAEADAPSIAVRIDDLNLARTADRDRLDTRIESAARRVCQSGSRGTAENARQTACIADVLSHVEPQTERAIARAQGESRLALLMVKAAR